ncbi:FecR family protein [Caulobacter sp.]|uniref:FecR family protein n=1 Tax=Caulobacter sp. TaxID=78 RepID=UPI002B494FC1|nr:FecR domain-containing protein [Caulobacter sp.]HJV42278.1 FecR domain-containing protein [Caulobacter sp.]
MVDRQTSQSIDDDAATWVARRDRAPLTPTEQAEFDAWLAGDDRRPGALMRLQAIDLASRAAGERHDLPFPASVSRRRMLLWGGASAAAGVAGLAVALQAPRAQATQRGEVRLVPLRDGSTMTLNTNSVARVKYGNDRRVIELIRGEAFFSVAGDALRPFQVEVAGRRLTTTASGAFRVSRLTDVPILVTVQQGQLDLSGGALEPMRLTANSRLELVAGHPPTVQRISARDVERDLAWREGKIAFKGDTLEDAAHAFARYGDPRVVIADPALAREPITGLFAANDPAGFSRTVAFALDATATRRGNEIVLSRSSSQ